MLSGPRNTKSRPSAVRSLSVAADAIIHLGGIVALAAGHAVSGQVANDLTSVGMADESVDNTGGVNGAKNIKVQSGCFSFNNSGSDPVDNSHIGKTVFIEDDETIAATDAGGTLSAAGILFDFDGNVWVNLGQ